jgi:myosin-5
MISLSIIRLLQEANEAGALRLAKSKLEKQLEDLTWRLQLEKRMRVLLFIAVVLF